MGFLPQKQGERKEFLARYEKFDGSLIFYSAPHDVQKDIESIYEVFGNRKAVAVKEITKIYERAEEFYLADKLKGQIKGEYVLVVEGKTKDENADLTNEQLIEKYIQDGLDKKSAIKQVAKERGVPKSELYKFTIGI